MNTHLKRLEWDTITAQLAKHAHCERAKEKCLALVPMETLPLALRAQTETEGAKKVIEQMGTPPLAAMEGLHKALKLIDMDAMLMPEQLLEIATFLVTCRRMKSYLLKAENTGAEPALYGRSMADLRALEEELERCIRNGRVDDHATNRLFDLRKRLITLSENVKGTLNRLLQKNPKWFSESFVSLRNGRYTLPVKRESRASVPGQVVELSASGATCFIEPASIKKITDEIALNEVEEDAEVRRILYQLTADVQGFMSEIKMNIDAMETLDFLFAKGKYALETGSVRAGFTDSGVLTLFGARHPLLDKNTAVPLDFSVGGVRRGVVVTGPNTGGKTVALKTIGLLSVMAQAGLQTPCHEDSTFVLRKNILCDIGDGQSITENLSTFSSHIVNINGILKAATRESLVLLDELGSGTDPQEGMGIAVAILEELANRGCLFIATTHYPQIKTYAAGKEGLINARMAFDRETLSPLYRLEIGAAGESCALFIAEKLGFPKRLLAQAQKAAYAEERAALPVEEEAFEMLPQVKAQIEKAALPRSMHFSLGDCVMVYPQKETGVVYAMADEKGLVGVMVRRKKQLINHKRLKVYIAATEMYPEDYDFSIVFDTVANRKARHVMEKRHDATKMVVEDGQ